MASGLPVIRGAGIADESRIVEGSVQRAYLRPVATMRQWLATHGRVDGIEDPQAIDIRHPVNGDGIAEIQHLAIRIGERRRPG